MTLLVFLNSKKIGQRVLSDTHIHMKSQKHFVPNKLLPTIIKIFIPLSRYVSANHYFLLLSSQHRWNGILCCVQCGCVLSYVKLYRKKRNVPCNTIKAKSERERTHNWCSFEKRIWLSIWFVSCTDKSENHKIFHEFMIKD